MTQKFNSRGFGAQSIFAFSSITSCSVQYCAHPLRGFAQHTVSCDSLRLLRQAQDPCSSAIQLWRCRWGLHPRMGVLQTPALLLGYGTTSVVRIEQERK